MPVAATAEPPGGDWLVVTDGDVGLAATPPAADRLYLGLRVAGLVVTRRPSDELLGWLEASRSAEPVWSGRETEALLDLIDRSNPRSWRFLLNSGLLDDSLPELAGALRARAHAPFALDSAAAYGFPAVERLRRLDDADPLARPITRLVKGESDRDVVLLAVFLGEALESAASRLEVAEATLARLALETRLQRRVLALVEAEPVLWAAAHRPGALSSQVAVGVAALLANPERAATVAAISRLLHADSERWELDRLSSLAELVQEVLRDATLGTEDDRTLADVRRGDAVRTIGDDAAVRLRIQEAPQSYVLRQTCAGLVRCAQLLEPLPAPRRFRVQVTPEGGGRWSVDIAARDRAGLLAIMASALADIGLDVESALVATWDDGGVVDSFVVRATEAPDPAAVLAAVQERSTEPLRATPLPAATVSFDNEASPWYTVCDVEATDRSGLLATLAAALTAAGVHVSAAVVRSHDGTALDTFELTGATGTKLDRAACDRVRDTIGAGVTPRRRRVRALERSSRVSSPR